MSVNGVALVQRVGRRIGRLRKSQGLTQQVLSERLGIALKNVQRLESGTQNLTLKTIARVAEAIGLQADDLLAPPEGRDAFLMESSAALQASSTMPPRPVPVLAMADAAVFARDGHLAQVLGWALTGHHVDERHFITRVDDDEMSPSVPRGSWNLFRRTADLPARGKVVLVVDGSAVHTRRLERLERDKRGQANVTLSSASTQNAPMVFDTGADGAPRVVAEHVATIRVETSR